MLFTKQVSIYFTCCYSHNVSTDRYDICQNNTAFLTARNHMHVVEYEQAYELVCTLDVYIYVHLVITYK